MSNNVFGLVTFTIVAIGIVGYAIIMLKVAKMLHDSQREYYEWLKQGGGQIQDIASYYKRGVSDE